MKIENKILLKCITDKIGVAFSETDKPSEYLTYLWDKCIFQEFIPEMSNADTIAQNPKYHPEGNVWVHTLETVDRCVPEYRWNALFHDIGKCEMARWQEIDNYHFFGHAQIGASITDDICACIGIPQEEASSIKCTTLLHMKPLSVSLQDGQITERAIRRLCDRVGIHMEAFEAVVRADSGDRYNEKWDAIWSYAKTKQIEG